MGSLVPDKIIKIVKIPKKSFSFDFKHTERCRNKNVLIHIRMKHFFYLDTDRVMPLNVQLKKAVIYVLVFSIYKSKIIAILFQN